MKVLQFLIFFVLIFFLSENSFSQETFTKTKIVSFPCAPESTFAIVDTNKLIEGYIVIEFDSVKYSQLQNNPDKYLSTYLYLVDDLSNIINGAKYFLNPYSLVYSGFLGYIESKNIEDIRNNHFHIDTSFFYSDESLILKRILTKFKNLNQYFDGFLYEDLSKISEPLINEFLPNRVFFIVKGSFESAIFNMKCHLNYDKSNERYFGDNNFLLPLSELINPKKVDNEYLKKSGFHEK